MAGRHGVERTAVSGLVAVLLVLAGCGGGRTLPDGTASELLASYAAADYFALRSTLDTLTASGPRVEFLRAAVAHAFNDPAGSNRHLAELESGMSGLPDTLRVEAHRLRFRNHVRLGEYRLAAEAARALLALPAADSAVRADVANEARAMEALGDVSPQRIVSRAASVIQRRPDSRVPVQVGDSVRGWVLDTGANFSTLMRSEAAALGLEVRKAGVEVGTSTGSTVTADVAVAPRLRLGGVELADVAFLVVPDEVLTFGPAFRIPGIIGFPVLDALGEVEFRRGGELRIPAEVPDRPVRNLAMRYLTPLVRMRVLGDDVVCELDTGASHTSLHLPFFEEHRARVEASGRPDSVRVAGAGSRRVIPTYVLPDVRVELGDTAWTVELPVYTESVAPAGEPDADCRLGLDLLAGFEGYRVNLRSMSFMPL